MPDHRFLVLGGAGLVGYQVAAAIAADLDPTQIVVASLTQPEVDQAVAGLADLTSNVEIIGEAGDVFVRESFAQIARRGTELANSGLQTAIT